jgi:hypothetical protein
MMRLRACHSLLALCLLAGACPAGETFHPVYEFGADVSPGEYRVPLNYHYVGRGLPVVSNVFIAK